MKGPYSKARAYVLRLGLVVEMLWWSCDPTAEEPKAVSLRSIETAIRLADYFAAHYRRVVAFVAGDEGHNADAEAMVPWILARPGRRFSLRQCADNFRRRFEGKKGALEESLAWLEKRGVVRRLDSPAFRHAGRRPTVVYEVNPSVPL